MTPSSAIPCHTLIRKTRLACLTKAKYPRSMTFFSNSSPWYSATSSADSSRREWVNRSSPSSVAVRQLYSSTWIIQQTFVSCVLTEWRCYSSHYTSAGDTIEHPATYEDPHWLEPEQSKRPTLPLRHFWTAGSCIVYHKQSSLSGIKSICLPYMTSKTGFAIFE